MKSILIVIALAVLAWFGYSRAVGTSDSLDSVSDVSNFTAGSEADPMSSRRQFTCDGRTHCSQMTSCEEAEFFLRNCPGVKMDGNNDGEPCESQWCDNSR